MNFKKQLRKEAKEARKLAKAEAKKYQNSLLRTDEEWEKIEPVIKERILQEVKKSDGDSWIELEQCNLPFHHKDIERFCKKHHLKVRYFALEDFHSDNYVMFRKYVSVVPAITLYRIKVRTWLLL